MAFATNLPRILTAVAVIVLTAVLFWFGSGLDPWWPLMWLAPLPVLLYALRGRWWSAAVVAFLGSLGGSVALLDYITHSLHAPFAVWLSVFSVAALAFAAATLLFRALARRGAVWSALFGFPAAWVTSEFLRNLLTPHGSAGSFAYSQLHFLPFLQLASLTGPWGMTFLLMLFSSTLALALHLRRTDARGAARIAGVGFGIVGVVLVFGAVRLAMPATGERVRVGLLAADVAPKDGVADPGAATETLFRDYRAQAETLIGNGAKVVLMPEKLGVLVDPRSSAGDAVFQSLADRTGATLVAGVVHVAAPVTYNEARIYAPRRAVLAYDKEHMLPPFESNLKPGTELTLLTRGQTPWGVAICKDMDFSNPARRYGQAGIGLLLDPGWDFNVDRGWHGHIAIMRGVESGFSIAHAAKNGYLTVTDDRGRILAETRSDSAPIASLMAEVPVHHDRTLYLLLGDWFAWVAGLVLAGALGRLAWLSTRRRAIEGRAAGAAETEVLTGTTR